MKPQNCLIFGASGFIGRHLIRKLTKNNFKVTAVTRNTHKSLHLKPLGNPGYIEIIESSIFDYDKIRNLFQKADICINLVGILNQKKFPNNFENIHKKFPQFLSQLCKANKVKLVHLSALGIEEAEGSLYAKSKLEGEILIRETFNEATILIPSLVYGQSDSSINLFYRLINLIPFFFPIYYKGKTKFYPICIKDLVEIIYQVIIQDINSKTVEVIGPEEMNFRQILEKLLKLINKKRFLISIPLPFAKFIAMILQIMPNPLLTKDALILLKTGSIPSGKYQTNNDINLPAVSNFEKEVSKFSYLYAAGGEYSKKNNLNNIN